MLLCSHEALERHRQKLDRTIALGRLCVQGPDAGTANGFSEEMMDMIGFEAEYLSGKMERRYLTAAVRQKAIDTHRAEFDFVEASAPLTLRIDFGASRIKRGMLYSSAKGG